MRLITFCFLIFHILSSVPCFSQGVDKVFSVAELKEDFKVVRNKYETTLANLYLYASKEKLDKVFDDLDKGIQPMSAEEFYKYITPLSSIIKDGHSNIYPPKENTAYHDLNSRFFPFNIYWKDGKMFIVKNLSQDTSIHVGNEIISINGLPAFSVMSYLLNRQVRDGNSENYAVWILNHYFREYYSYQFGHPDNYVLSIRNDENKFPTISIKALSKAEISRNKEARYPEFPVADDAYFKIDRSVNAGIFTIKTWDDKFLHQKIDDVFSRLKMKGIDNLIIDVRDNQGGDFEPAIYLLSYLLHEPFQYFSELKSVESKSDTGQVLSDRNGKMLGLHVARKDGYTGKLYVLINGGSFSNTASFCSRIEYYKRGVFIGEETGGNKVVFSGEFGLKGNTILPNTKIICENANYRMTVTDIKENTGHGVIPEFKLSPTSEDYIQGRDAILNHTFELIKSNH